MNKRQHQKTKVIFYPDSGFTVGSGARSEKIERKHWKKIRHTYHLPGMNQKRRRWRQLAKALRYRIRNTEPDQPEFNPFLDVILTKGDFLDEYFTF